MPSIMAALDPWLFYALAFAGPFLGLGLAHLTRKRYDRKIKAERPADGHCDLHFASVTAADDLVPLIDTLIKKFPPDDNTKLQIMGGNSNYIAQRNGKKLKNSIVSWIRKGIDVDYIVFDENRKVIDKFRDIKSKNPSYSSRLQVFVLDRQRTSEISPLVDELETHHPTLFFGPGDKRAMWIEGVHEMNSEYAFDVRYVSPNAMNEKKKGEFEDYRRKIDQVLKFCSNIDRNRRAVV